MNALMYTGISNALTEAEMSEKDINTNLISSLPKSTIIRACCMGTNPTNTSNQLPITVRIPLSDDMRIRLAGTLTPIESKYGFYDKQITIDKSICNTPEFSQYQFGTPENPTPCNDFYKLYCSNIFKSYKEDPRFDQNTYSYHDFQKFKPECGCYAEPPLAMKLAYQGTPLLDNQQCWGGSTCKIDNSNVWVPTGKRQICPLKINQCVQNIFANPHTANNVDVNNIQQINNCNFSSNIPDNAPIDSSTIPSQPSIPTRPPKPTIIPVSSPTIQPINLQGNGAPSDYQPPQQPSITPTQSTPLTKNEKIGIAVGVIITIIIIIAAIMIAVGE